MASGNFDKETGEVRPGTYINFVDEHDYSADGAGGGGSGSGGKSKNVPPDYYLGHSAEVVTETGENASYYVSDYLTVQEENLYCGDEDLLKEVS